MEIIIWTIIVLIIAIWYIIYLDVKWNKLKKELRRLGRQNLNLDNTNRELDINIQEKYKINKLLEKEYKRQVNIINWNASVMKKTFEDEIENLNFKIQNQDIDIKELKHKLHSEQVDSNNKGYARDKWKTKFDTLETTILGQNFWKDVVAKYKKTWKKIVKTYNESK